MHPNRSCRRLPAAALCLALAAAALVPGCADQPQAPDFANPFDPAAPGSSDPFGLRAVYADGKVTALIDWENARIGDPREDLGWMTTMDVLSNTSVMDHPRDKGGFLAYYNSLTGWDVTQDEVDWFTLFGTANIAVPVNAAIKRRVMGEHHVFSQLYMVQASAATLPNLVRLMNYPGVNL
jgi:hypothetical protein